MTGCDPPRTPSRQTAINEYKLALQWISRKRSWNPDADGNRNARDHLCVRGDELTCRRPMRYFWIVVRKLTMSSMSFWLRMPPQVGMPASGLPFLMVVSAVSGHWSL